MSPHDASRLLGRLEELFEAFSVPQRKLVEEMLERHSVPTVEAVIPRFAPENAIFDRGKLETALREEHARRSFRKSPTPEWQAASKADAKAREALLSKTPKTHIRAALRAVSEKYPYAFGKLPADPLESEMGKALVFSAGTAARVEAVTSVCGRTVWVAQLCAKRSRGSNDHHMPADDPHPRRTIKRTKRDQAPDSSGKVESFGGE